MSSFLPNQRCVLFSSKSKVCHIITCNVFALYNVILFLVMTKNLSRNNEKNIDTNQYKFCIYKYVFLSRNNVIIHSLYNEDLIVMLDDFE